MQIRRIFNEIFNISEPHFDNDACLTTNGLHRPMNAKGSNQPNINGSNGNFSTGVEKPIVNYMGANSMSDGQLSNELEEAMDLLYAYIEAELDGLDAANEFPKVHAAIQSSKEAELQYKELKDILQAEREGTLVIPSQVPDFDFSYLKPTIAALDTPIAAVSSHGGENPLETTWKWIKKQGQAETPQLFVQFSTQLIATFEQKQLQNSPSLRSRIKSGSSGKTIFSYKIDQREEHDLVIEFEASAVANNRNPVDEPADEPEFCNLTITVDRPSIDGAPFLADSRIHLSLPHPTDGQENESTALQAPVPSGDSIEQETIIQSTNPFGATIFRQIPIADLPKLKFVIEPAPPT